MAQSDEAGEGEGGEAARKRVLTLLAAMLFQTLRGHRWTPDAEQVRLLMPDWIANAYFI